MLPHHASESGRRGQAITTMIRRAEASDAQALSELLAQLGYPSSASEISARLDALRAFPRAWLSSRQRIRRGRWSRHRPLFSIHSRQPACGLAHYAGGAGRRAWGGDRLGARRSHRGVGDPERCEAPVRHVRNASRGGARVLREAGLRAYGRSFRKSLPSLA